MKVYTMSVCMFYPTEAKKINLCRHFMSLKFTSDILLNTNSSRASSLNRCVWSAAVITDENQMYFTQFEHE